MKNAGTNVDRALMNQAGSQWTMIGGITKEGLITR